MQPCIEFDPGELTTTTITYADFCNLTGFLRGDQITFIQVSHDVSKEGHDRDILTGFRYARVILEPSDGDMSSPLISGSSINKPNVRNAGSFRALFISSSESASGLNFALKDIAPVNSETQPDKEMAASAVILSRQSSGRWLRSTLCGQYCIR